MTEKEKAYLVLNPEFDNGTISIYELLAAYHQHRTTEDKARKKSIEAVEYIVSVWKEVQGENWDKRPDHVKQKFLEAHAAINHFKDQ